jgi:hypothetical protein
MIFLATLWIVFTLVIAGNATQTNPFSSNLFPNATPTQIIFALNIMSHISILALRSVYSSVMELARWALASSSNGVPIFSFLIMGQGIGLLGILDLLYHRQKVPERIVARHQLWGAQRLLLRISVLIL